MKKRIGELTMKSGIEVGDDIQEELNDVIKNYGDEMSALPPGDFRRIFWDQQVMSPL